MSARLPCTISLLALAATGACTGMVGTPLIDGGRGRTDVSTRDVRPGSDTGAPGMDAPVVGPGDVVTPGVDAPQGTDVPVAPADVRVDPEFDAGPCSAATLASAMVVTPLPVGARFAAPTSTGGVVVLADGASGGELHRFDGAGMPVGAAIPVAIGQPYGLAASPDRYAILHARDSDVLALAVYDLAGTRRADTVLIGGVPHDVMGNEWFGPLIRVGRVAWDGRTFAAYYSVQRLWPDGIAHYGDQLRTLTTDGAPESTQWDWGCSHSMDVRIASNASGLGPMCVSDCYPDKGVFFAHRTEVYLDPSGNCAGGVDTRLGGIAPVAGGFVLAFRTPAGRSSMDAVLVRVGDDRTRGATQWLSSGPEAAGDLDVASHGDGAVAAWTVGSNAFIQRVDSAGTPVGAPESIAADLVSGATDFFTFANGEAGWVAQPASGASGSRLVRVRVCR